MAISAQQRKLFDQYFAFRAQKAGAMTLSQKADLAVSLLKERAPDGRIPVPIGDNTSIFLGPDDPHVKAVLSGEALSVGGQTITRESTFKDRVAALDSTQRIVLFGGLVAAVIVLGILFAAISALSGKTEVTPTFAPTLTLPPTLASTLPPPTATPQLPTPTPMPTATPLVISVNKPAEGQNEPASITLGGQVYTLGLGQVKDGVWTLNNATGEWLANTVLRHVIALPATPDLMNVAASLGAGQQIELRLRSGEVSKYVVVSVSRAQQQQIESLTSREPSLVVVLYGEPSIERWIIVASAIQEVAGFTNFTAPIASGATQTVPNGQSVVDDNAAGLRMTVSLCRRVSQVGDQVAPAGQEYVVCAITFTALSPRAYSGQSLLITEKNGETPQVRLPVTGAMGDGTLTANQSVIGQVAGVVLKSVTGKVSQPILIWTPAGGARHELPLVVNP